MESVMAQAGWAPERRTAPERAWPFRLLLIVLIVTCLQPERIIPGGRALIHLPTTLLSILLLTWLLTWPKTIHHLQTKLFLAFLFLMMAHIFLARNSYRAWFNFKTIGFFYGVVFLGAVQFLDTAGRLRRYVQCYFFFYIFLAVLGIHQKGKVPLPILDDQNDFCLLMNVLVPIGFFLAQGAARRAKPFYYGAIILFITANVVSLSRGGFIGLLAAGAFLFYRTRRKVPFLLGLILLFFLIMQIAPAGYWSRMETIQTENYEQGTGRARVEFWEAGWRMFLEHPILGVGPGNYGVWLPDFFPGENPERVWGRVSHSLLFTLLSEMGLLGAVLFLGLLWGNYRDYRYIRGLERRKGRLLNASGLPPEEREFLGRELRKLHDLSLALAGATIAFLATGAFISVLWYAHFWLLTALWVVTGEMARQWERRVGELSPPDPHWGESPAAGSLHSQDVMIPAAPGRPGR